MMMHCEVQVVKNIRMDSAPFNTTKETYIIRIGIFFLLSPPASATMDSEKVLSLSPSQNCVTPPDLPVTGATRLFL